MKYGLPDSESHKVVEVHFVVAEERKAYAEAHFAHALRIAPTLGAALALISSRCAEPAPVAVEPEPEVQSDAPRVPGPVRARAPDVPFDLRRNLGLS